MLTLETALNLWLSEVKITLAETTYKNYDSFARSFVHSIGHDRDILAISHADALTWASLKSETRNNNSMRTTLTQAKAFFRWCIQHGYIDQNPFEHIQLPKVKNKGDERGVSDEDRNKLLRYTYYTSPRNFAIVMFLASTMCRLSAVAKLQVKNVDLYNRCAVVLEKGGRNEVVHFNQHTGIALRRYLEVRPVPAREHGFMWISRRSLTQEPLDAQGLAAMLQSASKAAGCSRIVNAHSFRHAGAQAWSRNPNIAPVDTQNKLNHSDFKSTQIYYAKTSLQVATLTDQHQILPDDLVAEMTGHKVGQPSNLIKFPQH